MIDDQYKIILDDWIPDTNSEPIDGPRDKWNGFHEMNGKPPERRWTWVDVPSEHPE